MTKKLYILILFCWLSLNAVFCHAQTANDTAKVNALNRTAGELRNINPDSCELMAKEARRISIKINYSAGEAEACLWQGTAMTNLGNYQEAIVLLKMAIKLFAKGTNIQEKRLLGRAYNNLGNVYWNKGLYTQALKYQYISLRLKEKINDKEGIAASYNNIGNIYSQQGKYDDALKSYLSSLNIQLAIGDEGGAGISYNNIGLIYYSKGDCDKALENYNAALKINTVLNNKSGIAISQSNIALCFEEQGNLEESLKRQLEALALKKEMGDQHGMSISCINIGSVYLTQRNFTAANNYFTKALNISLPMGAFEEIKGSYDGLYKTAKEQNDYESTLRYYKLYISFKDSLTNDENTKKQTQLEMQYIFDKKQTADSIKNAERVNLEEQKHQTEIKQQKIYTWGGVILFGIMLIVAIVSFRAFRNKQKANHIIAEQKLLVEEKQKEILDSIHYAGRIQKALLPSKKYIERNLDKLRNHKN